LGECSIFYFDFDGDEPDQSIPLNTQELCDSIVVGECSIPSFDLPDDDSIGVAITLNTKSLCETPGVGECSLPLFDFGYGSVDLTDSTLCETAGVGTCVGDSDSNKEDCECLQISGQCPDCVWERADWIKSEWSDSEWSPSEWDPVEFSELDDCGFDCSTNKTMCMQHLGNWELDDDTGLFYCFDGNGIQGCDNVCTDGLEGHSPLYINDCACDDFDEDGICDDYGVAVDTGYCGGRIGDDDACMDDNGDVLEYNNPEECEENSGNWKGDGITAIAEFNECGECAVSAADITVLSQADDFTALDYTNPVWFLDALCTKECGVDDLGNDTYLSSGECRAGECMKGECRDAYGIENGDIISEYENEEACLANYYIWYKYAGEVLDNDKASCEGVGHWPITSPPSSCQYPTPSQEALSLSKTSPAYLYQI
jgi:hypothetical protein